MIVGTKLNKKQLKKNDRRVEWMRSKYEIKAQKELEKEGYQVDYKIRPSRYYKGQTIDFFGLFDLIAVRHGDNLRFISIKGHMGVSRIHQKSIRNFWLPDCCQKEIWYFPKRKKKKNRKFIKKIIE